MIAQPTRQQVQAALRRNDIGVEELADYVLRPDGWLVVLFDADAGTALPPKDIYPPGPDCFGLLSPEAACVGLTSCPRARACSE